MAGGRVSHGRIIFEGFVDFDYEITLLTVRAKDADGQPETYFCDPIGRLQDKGDYIESWQPHPMSPVALQKSKDIGDAITKNLGEQGLFGVELFVKGDQVWFSEVSPRPHDTGMVTMITQWQNEFELHARAILGLPVDTRLRTPRSAVIYGGIDAAGIVFDDVDTAMRVPQTEIRLFGKREKLYAPPHGCGTGLRFVAESARVRGQSFGTVNPDPQNKGQIGRAFPVLLH